MTLSRFSKGLWKNQFKSYESIPESEKYTIIIFALNHLKFDYITNQKIKKFQIKTIVFDLTKSYLLKIYSIYKNVEDFGRIIIDILEYLKRKFISIILGIIGAFLETFSIYLLANLITNW